MNVSSSNIMDYTAIQQLPELLSGLSQKLQKFSALDWAEFTRTIKIFFSIGEICFSAVFSIWIIISGLLYVAEAMIFLKARRKSWSAVVPIYESYVLFDISIGKGILGAIDALLVYSILFVPLFQYVCGINCGWYTTIIVCFDFILRVFTKIKLAKKFNKGIGFSIGLIFLPFIFYPILGFGKSEYNFDGLDSTQKTV